MLTKYNIIIDGLRFDYLLCSVYARTRAEAMRLARREVLAGEKWRLERAD